MSVLAGAGAHMTVEWLMWLEVEHRQRIHNHGLVAVVKSWCLGAVVAPAFATAHKKTAAHLC